MRKIADYAEVVLREQYKGYVPRRECSPRTIEEWAINEANNDPHFYVWLFDDGSISDFGSNLSDEEREVALNFFKTL